MLKSQSCAHCDLTVILGNISLETRQVMTAVHIVRMFPNSSPPTKQSSFIYTCNKNLVFVKIFPKLSAGKNLLRYRRRLFQPRLIM